MGIIKISIPNAPRPHTIPKQRRRAKYVANTDAVQLRVQSQAQPLGEFDRLRVMTTVGIVPSYETILPRQFFDAPPRTGAEKLMLAMLDDAVNIVLGPHFGSRSNEAYQDAMRWIMNTDTSWLFGFESICTALNFNAKAIRKRLIEKGTEA